MEDKDLRINTGLKGFRLLEALGEVDEERISGTRRCAADPAYLGVECLAQLGAWHVRFLTDFQRHAFLLKINRCLLPRQEVLEGTYRFAGRLLSRSQGAFSYELTAKQGKEIEFMGIFLYAAVDYDERFPAQDLRDYYIKVFSCLQNAAGNGSASGQRRGSSAPRP